MTFIGWAQAKPVDVRSLGVEPYGTKDCSATVNAALASGQLELHFPSGEYRLDRPLSLPSGTHLTAARDARLFASAANAPEAIVSNADWNKGNADIVISGGVWDGCAPLHPRKGWNDPAYPARLFVFVNVKGLVLEHMTMVDGVTYHVGLSRVRDFRVEDIAFEGTYPVKCQDGVHLWGGCEDGVIRDIRCRFGATYDDLIALNADDVARYTHNKGGVDAPIRRIRIEKVRATSCHSVFRFLSIRSKISDIVIRDVKAGYREFGINADAARYCADPIFDDAAYPEGVGEMENVLLEDVELWYAGDKRPPNAPKEVVVFETNARNFVFRNFRHAREREPKGILDHPTFNFRNLRATTVDFAGTRESVGREQRLFSGTDYPSVVIGAEK